jgi:hypothetical protein
MTTWENLQPLVGTTIGRGTRLVRGMVIASAALVMASGCVEQLHQQHGGSTGWDTEYLFWPPPGFTSDWQSGVQLEGRSFGQVADRMAHVLEAAGYADTRVFRIGARYDHGFAVITRLEQIQDDGAPSSRERWSSRFPAAAELKWLGGARRPHLPGAGRYRTFVLAVTDVPRKGTRPTPWDERTVMDGPVLPAVPFPADRKLSSATTLTVYVYEYAATSAAGEGAFVDSADSRISAAAHVRAAGLSPIGEVL